MVRPTRLDLHIAVRIEPAVIRYFQIHADLFGSLPG
jgi:hypothetical protein